MVGYAYVLTINQGEGPNARAEKCHVQKGTLLPRNPFAHLTGNHAECVWARI